MDVLELRVAAECKEAFAELQTEITEIGCEVQSAGKAIFSKEYFSVADPGCLSRMPDPNFYPSRIQKQDQKRGVKKNLLLYLFYSHKIHKIVNYFIFEMLKKNC